MRVSAPGKMILLGEYAVLEGFTGMVAAVGRHAQVSMCASLTENWTIRSTNLDIPPVQFRIDQNREIHLVSKIEKIQQHRLNFVFAALRQFAATIDSNPTELPPLKVSVDTSAFYHVNRSKLGLGASAAITVALLIGLYKYFQVQEVGNKLYPNALNTCLSAHANAQQGQGSGIDVAASFCGGIIAYKRKTPPVCRPLSLWSELQILPVWTGYSASTRTLLTQVLEFKSEQPEVYDDILTKMALITEAGIAAYSKKKSSDFMEIVDTFYNLMRELGDAAGIQIISEAHEKIHEIVTRCGGVYKPSGAGHGDIGVAITPSRSVEQQIRDELSLTEYTPLELQIVHDGVREETH